MSLPPGDRNALLLELEEAHAAFLEARLISDRAAAEWRANLEAGWAELLRTPVGRIIGAAEAADLADALLSRPAVREALRPAVRSSLLLASARLREDPRRLGDYVPAEARASLDALLEQRGIVPEKLLRQVMEHDAVEEVMRDVLFDALKEFQEKVNPFFADWGLPALLGKLSPFGLGGMKKGFDSMRAEFDRRLEPEIRKFLQGFSRKSLRTFSSHTVANIDEPEFVALRKRLALWMLEQEVSSVVYPEGDRRAAMAEALALDLVEHVLAMPEVRAQRRAAIELAVTAHAKQTLAEALAVYGVTHTPDFDAVAAATWPAVRNVLGSEPVRRWLRAVVSEFYETQRQSGG